LALVILACGLGPQLSQAQSNVYSANFIISGFTMLGNGTCQFSFNSVTGVNYSILAGPNQNTFAVIATVTASGGVTTFTDAGAATVSNRFYEVQFTGTNIYSQNEVGFMRITAPGGFVQNTIFNPFHGIQIQTAMPSPPDATEVMFPSLNFPTNDYIYDAASATWYNNNTANPEGTAVFPPETNFWLFNDPQFNFTLAGEVGLGTNIGGVAPGISGQPQSLAVPVGQTATFSVTASGTAPLLYQWQSNGTNLSDNGHLSGSLTTNLVISNVQTNDAGQYKVVVTNLYGAATSAVATLTVNPPANDTCAGAIPLTNGVTVTQSNILYATGVGDPNTGCASGIYHGVWYTVTPTKNQRVGISTCASDFDTRMAVYTGGCGGLVEFACNDNNGPYCSACCGNPASVSFSGFSNVTYYILVGGNSPTATGNLRIVADLQDPPPNDTCAGAIALVNGVTNTVTNIFYATEDGDPNTGCAGSIYHGVWYTITPAKNQRVGISTCASDFDTRMAVYTGGCGGLTEVVCNDNNGPYCSACCGNPASVSFSSASNVTYYILVGGNSPTATGTLRIVADLQDPPSNDACAGAIPLVNGVMNTVSNMFYATEVGDPSTGCAGSIYHGVWYTVTPIKNQRVGISTCASDFDTRMAVYTGGCGGLTEVVCNDNNGPYCSACCGNPASVSFSSLSNVTYYILVGGNNPTVTGTLRIVADLQDPPPNDTCAGAIPLVNGVMNTVSNIFYATEVGDPTTGCAGSIYHGVWYTVTPTKNQRVGISTCASDFDTRMAVYTGGCGGLTEVACNDNNGPYCSACCGNPASVSFSSVSNVTYYILVGGNNPTVTGTLRIVADLQDPPPNDTCAGATPLVNAVMNTVSNIFYATEVGDPTTGCAGSIYHGVWYTVTPTKNQRVGISTCASDFDTRMAVYTGGCGGLTEVACNDNNGPYCSACCGNPASVSFSSVSNVTYYILVGGNNPTVTGTLRIVADLQDPPPNDTCAGAIPLVNGVMNTVSNIFYATEIGDAVSACASGIYHGVWYTVTPTKNQRVGISTCASDFDTRMAVYTGGCGGLTEFTCNDNNGPYCSACCGNPASVSFSSVSNVTYYILVGGNNPTVTGTLRIVADLQDPPPNDTCAGAIALVNGVTNTVTNIFYATEIGDPTTNCAGSIFHGVWYSINATSNQQVNINTCPSDFNTRLAVYTGSCGSLVEFLCNDDNGPFCTACCGNPASASFTSPGNRTYYILVGGNSPTGTGTLRIVGDVEGPPGILLQPGNSTSSFGSVANFTVIATGTAPLSYQWHFNGTNLANNARVFGSQSMSLGITNVLSTDAGNYQVVITNAFGSMTSTVATLTVTCPAITVTPSAPPPAPAAAPYSFNLGAIGGTPPYTFALTAGSLPTGLNLTTNGLISGTPSAVGTNTFTVTATDSNGCTGSLAYSLNVSLNPVIISESRGTNGAFQLSFISGIGTTNIILASTDLKIWVPIGVVVDSAGLAGFIDPDAGLYPQRFYRIEIVSGSILPVITSQPQNQTNTIGTSATFAVAATSPAPLSYQWLFNGTNLTGTGRISGSQSTTLIISNLSLSDVGTYQVMVSNLYGSVTSSAALLVVQATNSPAGDLLVVKVTDTQLYRYQSSGGTATAIASVGGNATDVTAGEGVALGQAWVARPYASTIYQVDLLSGAVATFASGFGFFGVAYHNGLLYTTALDNAVRVYDATTGSLLSIYTDPIASQFLGVRYDRTNDRIVLSDRAQGVIYAMTLTGSFSIVAGGFGFDGTYHIAVEPNGDVLVSGYLAQTIDRVDIHNSNSVAIVASGAPLNAPVGVTEDGAGHIFAANYGDGNLVRLNVDGTGATNLGSIGGPGGKLYSVILAPELVPAPVLTWTNPAPITYGTALSSNQLNATANVPGTNNYTPPAGVVLSAGTNLLSDIFTPTDSADYSVVTGGVTLVVLPAPLTVTAGSVFRPYGLTNPPLTVTVSGLLNGDSITAVGACLATATSPPGNYPITPVLNDPNNRLGNYNVTTNLGTLTVLKASGTVSLGSLAQTYDGTAKSASATTVPPGLTVTFTYNGSANPPTNAGNYAVVGTILDTNYQGSANGTLVVSRAGATVLLGGLAQTYDATAKVASATTTPPGLTVGLTYNGSGSSPTNAGSYTVVAAVTDPNYQGGATNTLVIGKANATVTANNAARVFGQPNPLFTGTSIGLLAADNITVSYSCAATNNSPVGTYPIVPNLNDPGSRLGNYLVTITNGTLTVLPSAPTFTWTNPAAITYGTQLGATQLNASATIAGSFTYNPPAGTALNAGTNTLLATFTPTDTNDYSGATINANLVVLPASLTVTANNATRIEGQTNPVFTGTISGLVNGDNITATFTSSATAASPAGTYPIVPGLNDPNNRLGNYIVTTNNGTLTVNAANDLFVNRKTISGVSNTLFSSNANATKEPGEPNHAGNSGGHSLWWTWTAPAQGNATLNTIGSSFDTLLAVYTGTSVSNLVPVASDEGSGGNHNSLLTFLAAAGATYQIAVDGFNDGTNAASGGIVLNLFEDYGPPQFVAQPQGQTVPASAAVTFSASVKGSQPAFYQWLKNGVAVPGATNAQFFTNTLYAIASAQTNDSGSYSVGVSNSFGSAVSSSALLTVFTRPGNDAYANAYPLSGLTNTTTGNNTYATPDCSGTGCFEPPLFAGHSVWWTWTAPTNGSVVVDTIGSSFDTVLALYTNDLSGSNVLITYDDQSGGNNTSRIQFDTAAGVTYHFGVDGSRWAPTSAASGNIILNLRTLFTPPQITVSPQAQSAELGWGVSFSVAATGTTPLAYQWLKNGAPVGGATNSIYAIVSVQASDPGAYSAVASNAFGSASSSNATLTLYGPPANDNFANRLVLPGSLTITATGVNVGATKEPGEPNHAGNPGGRSVWWSWTAPTNGTVVINTLGSSFDTLVAIYNGNSVSNLSLVAADDNSGPNLTSRAVFSATAGSTYQIAVDGYNPSGPHGAAYGNIVLNLQQSAIFAPLVLTQPLSQAVASGGSVTFNVAAAGTPAPTYQWLFNGTALAGQTSTALQLTKVATNQAGAYSVLVSNLAGVVASATATLRVEKALNPGFRSDWPGFVTGDAMDVTVADGLVYAATTAGLLILDPSDPTNLRLVGSYNTDSAATRIAVQDGFVYLLTSSNQLGGATISRFDARNPGLPRKIAEYVTVNATDFSLADDLLCAVDRQSLLVLNTNCALVGSLSTANGQAAGIVVSNGFAYVTWPNFVGVYSLANPAAPAQVATLGQSQAELALAGGYLYTVTGGQRVVQVRLLDPNNLQRPQVGLSSLSNVLGQATQQGVTVGSNAVFVVTAGFDGNALGVYSPLGQPWNPVLLATNLFPEGTPHRAATDGAYLYIANGGAGLKIFDVTDPTNPVAIGQFFTSIQANSLALQGNQAYVMDVHTGFHVVDVSDPTVPASLGAYESPNGAAAIAVRSHYVYLALNAPPTSISISGPSLQIVDVADAAHPQLLGSVTLPGPNLARLPQAGDPSVAVTALAAGGNLVLIGSYLSGSAALGIVDVSNPAAPVVAGRFNLPGSAQIASLDFDGRYAYLADANYGLRLLDLAIPSSPVQLGAFPEPSACSSISVQSNLCLLTGAFGTDLLDVSQPANPVRLGNNSITGTLNWLQAPLALGSSPNGVQVFDLVNFTSPLLIGQFAGAYSEVKVQGRYAFAAGDEAGLTVLDLGSLFATPPVILAQPVNLRVLPGATANFYVAVVGTVPLTYQWSFNGVNLSDGSNVTGSQSESLHLTAVQASAAGQYSVQVGNTLGSASGVMASLSVDQPPSVTLASPSDQQAFSPGANIPLAANAADADGTVAQVAFYNGASLLGVVANPPYTFTWNNVLAGIYVLTAVATDNEGASTVSSPATIVVTNLPVIQFSQANYSAHESNGVATVTVLRNSSGPASVDYFTADGTALSVAPGRVGSYYGTTNTLVFPSGVLASNVTVQLVNSLVYRGNRTFQIRLANPAAGWALASPSNTTVTILDDNPTSTTNSFTTVIPAAAPTSDRGSLTILLQPAAANGQWRFPWETAWRPSGSTATNLVPGNYPLVFNDRAGWETPDPDVWVVSPGINETNSYTYISNGIAGFGSLTVNLHPDAVIGLGQWRPVENPPGPWLNSGTLLTNVPAGLLVVEFSDVTGYSTPASRFVQISAGQGTLIDVNYFLAPAAAPGEAPRPLPNLAAMTNPSAPYQFQGQMLSDVGYSSGFVVKDRTVLTAAHALFDPVLLTYSTNTVWWFFQREAGEYDPVPQVPRGWYVFDGYAGSRTADIESGHVGPDESSTITRQQDVAALYFFEAAGRGGYGGYLTTVPGGTDWLLSGALMLLTGYPVETVPVSDRGRLHQVGPGYATFQNIPSTSLYFTTDFQSYPGNSGGPLCVQSANSLGAAFFIPAGVYLGGSGETVVRSIDLDVVDLINRADVSSHGGGNSTGGGVISISAGTVYGDTKSHLLVNLGPANAISAGAAFSLDGGATYLTNASYQTHFASTVRSVTLTFRPITGWEEPPSAVVTLTVGQTAVVTANYVAVQVHPPVLFTNAQLLANGALVLTLQGVAGKAYSIVSTTNLFTPLTNWTESVRITNTAGQITFTNPPSPSVPQRYYRAKEL
jgi:hypothetical protein